MNLEPAAQSLLEQFPAGKRPDLDKREQRIETFGQIAFTGFMIVIGLAVLGLIYAILDKMVFSGDNPWAGILLMNLIIFAMLTLAWVVFREDLKEKRAKAARQTAPELEMPAVTGRLLEEKEFEPIPTVTESTTDLLPRENTRKL
jgi:hypothetical protein